MVEHGFHHVLAGADHLLFLTTLLLVAPVFVAAGTWHRRTNPRTTVRNLLGVVTAFTTGHSVTLIASTLGWVQLPTTPIEVLVALSVAVAGVHALRPLFPHGELFIAAGFGLIHGLAFAGILVDLGLDGSTGFLALLAFNVGVELAQLAATLLLFPSIDLLSRTRFYPAVRGAGCFVAVAAATGWVCERLGLLDNPLAPLEEAAIGHPWAVVCALATVAATAWLVDRKAAVGQPAGTFVLLGGLPGAGKTTALQQLKRDQPDVRMLDPDEVRRALARRLPPGTAYRRYRPLVHITHTARVLLAILRRPRKTTAPLVVHDPATRPRRRELTARLTRWCGWHPHLLLIDATPEQALAGQRQRGRVLNASSFAAHHRRWREERDRMVAGTRSSVDNGAWRRISLVDRDDIQTAIADVLRADSHSPSTGGAEVTPGTALQR